MTGGMVKSLFKLFNKPKTGTELLTELDISRVFESKNDPSADAEAEAEPTPTVDTETWKKNDLDLLQMTWQACCDAPDSEESKAAFRNALHNLHGASGAYGGGALTRLTSSLQELVSNVSDLQDDAALVNLHVQACRAASLSDGAGDDVADAVCDALEQQVETRLHG